MSLLDLLLILANRLYLDLFNFRTRDIDVLVLYPVDSLNECLPVVGKLRSQSLKLGKLLCLIDLLL